MQLSQEVEVWLRLASVAVPSIVALIVPVITYRLLMRKMADYQTQLSKDMADYQNQLSKGIEDHKKGISKELELYKLQLQSSFQTKLYEFQTRYSLLHQKRAEAIEKLFGLLAKVQNDLQIWAYWGAVPRKETKEEFFLKTQEDFQNMIDYFDEKRIYFDEEIKNSLLQLVRVIQLILDSHNSIESASRSIPILADQIKNGSLGTRVVPSISCGL